MCMYGYVQCMGAVHVFKSACVSVHVMVLGIPHGHVHKPNINFKEGNIIVVRLYIPRYSYLDFFFLSAGNHSAS